MQEIDILKEINKDAKMGMDSITMVNKKVQDENFKQLLDTQHNEYQNIFEITDKTGYGEIGNWYFTEEKI